MVLVGGLTGGLQLGPMTKQQALEVLVEVLKRAPVSFVEGYGVREAVEVLGAGAKEEAAAKAKSDAVEPYLR